MPDWFTDIEIVAPDQDHQRWESILKSSPSAEKCPNKKKYNCWLFYQKTCQNEGYLDKISCTCICPIYTNGSECEILVCDKTDEVYLYIWLSDLKKNLFNLLIVLFLQKRSMDVWTMGILNQIFVWLRILGRCVLHIAECVHRHRIQHAKLQVWQNPLGVNLVFTAVSQAWSVTPKIAAFAHHIVSKRRIFVLVFVLIIFSSFLLFLQFLRVSFSIHFLFN